MIKPCATCGTTITGATQKRFCRPCRNLRYAVTLRSLRPGEQVPVGAAPRRFANDRGYIRLRWRVGPKSYVEAYEHRVLDGRVTTAQHVHHLNHVRTDNRPENLQPMSAAEHHVIHGDPGWWIRAARLYATGLSTNEIGKQLSKNRGTVYRALVSLGVPLRRSARVAIPNRERKSH